MRRRISWRAMLAAGLLIGLALVVAAVFVLRERSGVPGWAQRAEPVPMRHTTDDALRAGFADSGMRVSPDAWDLLFRHVLEGFLAYRTPGGAAVHLPGAPSGNGRASDGLEGFARTFALAGAWLASGRPDIVAFGDRSVSISERFRAGLAAGTNPSGPEYWGDIRDHDQRLVEAADVALGLWLSRATVWEGLSEPERRDVVRWLARALDVQTFDGVWSLFPQVVHRALAGLGVDTGHYAARLDTQWEQFKALQYRGDGWFFDPPRGFDYYNAWAIHYALYWLDRMDPDFDPAFVRDVSARFARSFKHLLGPEGPPLLGRSPCYRMALPAPLAAAAVLAPEAVSAGEARRAMDTTWSWFVRRGAMAGGTVTQGFCGEELAILDRYSGPASCLWALRSLVVAFDADRRIGLFSAEHAPLPVEVADFSLTVPATGWTIAGTRATGEIRVVLPDPPSGPPPALRPYGVRERVLEAVLHRPFRPDNRAALYGRGRYSNLDPIATCPRP